MKETNEKKEKKEHEIKQSSSSPNTLNFNEKEQKSTQIYSSFDIINNNKNSGVQYNTNLFSSDFCKSSISKINKSKNDDSNLNIDFSSNIKKNNTVDHCFNNKKMNEFKYDFVSEFDINENDKITNEKTFRRDSNSNDKLILSENNNGKIYVSRRKSFLNQLKNNKLEQNNSNIETKNLIQQNPSKFKQNNEEKDGNSEEKNEEIKEIFSMNEKLNSDNQINLEEYIINKFDSNNLENLVLNENFKDEFKLNENNNNKNNDVNYMNFKRRMTLYKTIKENEEKSTDCNYLKFLYDYKKKYYSDEDDYLVEMEMIKIKITEICCIIINISSKYCFIISIGLLTGFYARYFQYEKYYVKHKLPEYYLVCTLIFCTVLNYFYCKNFLIQSTLDNC